MRIVVNHLTRMQKGYMCVAGIDVESGSHMRPVLGRLMSTDMLSAHGGPFDIGRIVDLGKTRFEGRVPEIEDQWFDGAQVQHVGDLPADEFWQLLEQVAQDKLGAIFGPDLERVGSTCAVAEAHGLRSLGCYWSNSGQLYTDDGNGKQGRRIRFSWQTGDHAFTAPVTDIRLYEHDHITPCESTVQTVADVIADQPRVLVSVGLSRPYRKAADDPPRHWLQINNFHLPDNPCWQLGGP